MLAVLSCDWLDWRPFLALLYCLASSGLTPAWFTLPDELETSRLKELSLEIETGCWWYGWIEP
jgi:hypothetical protein